MTGNQRPDGGRRKSFGPGSNFDIAAVGGDLEEDYFPFNLLSSVFGFCEQ
jgi:hypothetical protein